MAYFFLYESFPVIASIWAKWLPIVEEGNFSFLQYLLGVEWSEGKVHVRGAVWARAVCEYEGGQPGKALIKATGCE
ncbi:hypothetical protein [Reichenbachiella ulvae]|uniref:Uncharacterized protein n=1 Tax=Reichenbachiella ulvae TaxID=2980104 RepID=A0ABT3CWV2_9BACT|nr:hypothetical protein [Reichenbachiella ulvae]MCV9388079.1 hypothetical protein [Reichenbachiella ulvae]